LFVVIVIFVNNFYLIKVAFNSAFIYLKITFYVFIINNKHGICINLRSIFYEKDFF